MAGKRDKVLTDVPYFSQILDVGDPYWRERSCSIVCLKMLLEFHRNGVDVPNIDELIEEGIIIGGRAEKGTDDVGWRQSSIVALGRNRGLVGYNEEFRSINVDIKKRSFSKSKYEKKIFSAGIDKIERWLKAGQPVIVSVPKNFKKNGSPHTVLLVGVEKSGGVVSGFLYHDSNFLDRELGRNRFVDFCTFEKRWRKMAIFLKKPE